MAGNGCASTVALAPGVAGCALAAASNTSCRMARHRGHHRADGAAQLRRRLRVSGLHGARADDRRRAEHRERTVHHASGPRCRQHRRAGRGWPVGRAVRPELAVLRRRGHLRRRRSRHALLVDRPTARARSRSNGQRTARVEHGRAPALWRPPPVAARDLRDGLLPRLFDGQRRRGVLHRQDPARR